ncbi:hypothetical protein CEXT_409051 [Caerostris extrusa]|uniref:Uncharacterized protein n=1 Tax=Caerostris extrusa TaxID=172846 RepID=A0AAV4MNH0_CAEEX|nr:hypothetical protein CEXT_409051 [Caerostris extrusa]
MTLGDKCNRPLQMWFCTVMHNHFTSARNDWPCRRFSVGLPLNNMEGKKKPCSRLVVPNPTSGKSLSETHCWLLFSPPLPPPPSPHLLPIQSTNTFFYSSLCTICQFNRQLKKKKEKKSSGKKRKILLHADYSMLTGWLAN